MNDKNQHGGKREGAGRHPTLKNPVRITVWITSEQLDWVKAQGETSDVIRRLISRAMEE